MASVSSWLSLGYASEAMKTMKAFYRKKTGEVKRTPAYSDANGRCKQAGTNPNELAYTSRSPARVEDGLRPCHTRRNCGRKQARK